jgi:soluble lytic murein transglycosylase
VQRAVQLWRLRLSGEAATEFSLARADLRDNAWGLLALAEYTRDAGLPYQAMAAANRVLGLSSVAMTAAPRYLQRLLYPVAYRDVVQSTAATYGVDPLWLFALIRQESAFDRYAFSSADARGLTQVIPATGNATASQLGVKDFRQDDLFKPVVSLRFGAWLLGQNLKATDGNTFVALAGYNGGLGNALRWAKIQPTAPPAPLSTIDDDLFAEDISFSETQAFVHLVFEHHAMYVILWAGQ